MPRPNQSAARHKRTQEKFVKDLLKGKFEGHFRLEWTGPESFTYHPDPDDPFRYTRFKANGKKEIIQPEKMWTDGGSIPIAAQALTGRTPWEYGPAFMIHDWEFHRHDIDPSFKKSFKQANLTLAEAIWTLMNDGYLRYKKPKKSPKNVLTIHAGVCSPIAKAIWDN